MIRVVAPATDGSRVYGLANLPAAGRLDTIVALVEIQASGIPLQSDEVQDRFRPGLGIVNEVLVVDLMNIEI